MDRLLKETLSVNEAEETYKNEVPLSIHFAGVGLDDDEYEESPDKVEIEFDIDVDHRSWGIKDINVFLRGVVEFEVVVKSDLPDEEGKEVVIPVKIDFADADARIIWMDGSGYAPAELIVTLEGEEVKDVEVDFYYLKP